MGVKRANRERVAGPEACVCFNFRKAARVVTKIYEDALRPSGLTATQFSMLAVTSFGGPVTMARLAGHLATERTTLTRNLRHLQSKGLVRVKPGWDQRTKLVSLSKKGSKALADALPLWSEAQARVTEQIGSQRWGSMLGDLQEIVELLKAGQPAEVSVIEYQGGKNGSYGNE
jgi:DNA-binding MarR family transcriptional regulator